MILALTTALLPCVGRSYLGTGHRYSWGGTVAWWLARLPHTFRLGVSTPTSAVCVEFACSPRALGVSS
ncbi:hypothetical protein QTP86_024810, partial [Hemibagrus guttatus]